MDSIGIDGLTDEVMADVDVFRPFVENGVFGEFDGAGVVGLDGRGGLGEAEFGEEATEPVCFLGRSGQSHVFGFGG